MQRYEEPLFIASVRSFIIRKIAIFKVYSIFARLFIAPVHYLNISRFSFIHVVNNS